MFCENVVEEAFNQTAGVWQEKYKKTDERLKHAEQEMELLMAKFNIARKEVKDLRQEIKAIKETPPPPPPPSPSSMVTASAQEVKDWRRRLRIWRLKDMEKEIESLKEASMRSITLPSSMSPPVLQTQPRTTVPGRYMGNAPGSYAQAAARFAVPASSSATSLRSTCNWPAKVVAKGHSFSKIYAATERRILFHRNPQVQYLEYKQEGDLMLALNEALQGAGVELQIRFGRIGYAKSGAISALLNERAYTGMILPKFETLLLDAIRGIDKEVTTVEAVETWCRLKVHGIPFDRYMERLDLLQREIEAATGIALKTPPRWLAGRAVHQRQEKGQHCSTVVVTVGAGAERNILRKGIRLGSGVPKRVEDFWEAGPGAVCPTCCGIRHGAMDDCQGKEPRCLICAGNHVAGEHKCGTRGCGTEMKACIHTEIRCADCGGEHTADNAKCPASIRAQMQAKRTREQEQERIVAKEAAREVAKEEEGEAMEVASG
ncbi:MAG: hypothetical protein MMC33_010072 [Icmadophila ericetorum]|nr:hypothetical protein [Icmadophila ericetorum]